MMISISRKGALRCALAGLLLLQHASASHDGMKYGGYQQPTLVNGKGRDPQWYTMDVKVEGRPVSSVFRVNGHPTKVTVFDLKCQLEHCTTIPSEDILSIECDGEDIMSEEDVRDDSCLEEILPLAMDVTLTVTYKPLPEEVSPPPETVLEPETKTSITVVLCQHFGKRDPLTFKYYPLRLEDVDLDMSVSKLETTISAQMGNAKVKEEIIAVHRDMRDLRYPYVMRLVTDDDIELPQRSQKTLTECKVIDGATLYLYHCDVKTKFRLRPVAGPLQAAPVDKYSVSFAFTLELPHGNMFPSEVERAILEKMNIKKVMYDAWKDNNNNPKCAQRSAMNDGEKTTLKDAFSKCTRDYEQRGVKFHREPARRRRRRLQERLLEGEM